MQTRFLLHIFHYASILVFSSVFFPLAAQPAWKLWASGLQMGVYPKMTVAPNHDIFYTLMGAGTPQGVVYKANTNTATGTFIALPAIPLPSSHVNNINALGYNQNSEPIAGIYRNNVAEPFIFRFDNSSQTWIAATSNIAPNLGAHCIVTASNGTIFIGAKWANVYKSTDNGSTFTAIDETASIQAAYPCYYPSYTNAQYDGAIFGINIDGNGRLYVGTESAGLVYSDNQGISWHPADYDVCLPTNNTIKNPNSPMMPLSRSGNLSAIGFTANNNVVWSGPDMWTLNWNNKLGFADMTAHTTTQVLGIPNYLVQTGQQITKIVTASNGQMFLHSGSSNGALAADIGIYTSMDGLHWTQFNTGITGQNDGQSQGSLAVDGTKVFFATHDGKIWMYDVASPLAITDLHLEGFENQDRNSLAWKLGNQATIANMEIQRSTVGANWQKLDNIEVNAHQATYSFDDKQPLQDAFYRLIVTEINGEESVSNTVHIYRNSLSYPLVSVFPNPCSDMLTLKLYNGKLEEDFGEIEVSNLEGKIIEKLQAKAIELRLDISKWASGIYFLKVKNTDGNWVQSVKICKE